jgi:hypothetical protein
VPGQARPKIRVYHESELASCRGQDYVGDNAWYSSDPNVQAYAKDICWKCPVKDWCRKEVDSFEENLEYSSWWGIWAGETKGERRTRRRIERLEREIFEV